MEIGIIGAIILAFQVYAIWNILHEPWEGFKKILWVVIVLFFQVFGTLAYFLFFRTTHLPIFPQDK